MGKSDSLDPNRGRTKVDDGGAGHAGYANKATKNWDDNANYTRPPKCADPYNSPNEKGSEKHEETGY